MLLSGARNRPLIDILRGVTAPVVGPGEGVSLEGGEVPPGSGGLILAAMLGGGGGGGRLAGGRTQTASLGQYGSTLEVARFLEREFDLTFSSGYRTPAENAAAGGVQDSYHTRGSPQNPGAIDMTGSTTNMQRALTWARKNLPLAEGMIHDAGSGLHLHLGFRGF